MMGRLRFAEFALAAAAALVLVGCGDSPDPAATVPGPDSAQVAKVRREAATQTENMVAAVAAGKPGAPIDVRFDVTTKPRLGEPLEIKVAVVPLSAVARLHVVFQGNDGLTVTSNGELGPLDKPKVGAIIRHVVTVVPRSEGVFTLSAVAVTEEGDANMSRSFAMPLIVGVPDAAMNKTTSAAKDATGQSIQSLPAVETPH